MVLINMQSYLFKLIAKQYVAIEPLQTIFADSDSANEKVRSTDLIFSETDCLELIDDKIIIIKKTQDIIDAYELPNLKLQKIQKLDDDYNASKKITIQNGRTVIIKHDTPEREKFLKLIENVRNNNAVFIYKQKTNAGSLALRILPEIAAYIFKDLFIATLKNGTSVPVRSQNKAIIYENALDEINNASTQAELDDVTWSFINPRGIVIDVNDKANEMLADLEVSDFAKEAINAAKDPATDEIHLVKTLQELADDS